MVPPQGRLQRETEVVVVVDKVVVVDVVVDVPGIVVVGAPGFPEDASEEDPTLVSKPFLLQF